MLVLFKKEVLLVKFPIIFPMIYGLILFLFPQFETQLIFLAILLLAEPHFGATWPFFIHKTNYLFIKENKISLILIPIIGQMLHFYLDSQLWKFSNSHNRNAILRHIK